MSQRKIKFESSAQIIFAGKNSYEGYKDGDVLAVAFESRNHGTLHRFYTLGSVVGYAIKNCHCPFEEVERAEKLGHELHWANANAVTISSHQSSCKEISFMVEHGEVINFHGKSFEIVNTSNNNIGLKATLRDI